MVARSVFSKFKVESQNLSYNHIQKKKSILSNIQYYIEIGVLKYAALATNGFGFNDLLFCWIGMLFVIYRYLHPIQLYNILYKCTCNVDGKYVQEP